MKKTALPDHMSVVIPSDKALAMLNKVKDGRINGAKIKKTGGRQRKKVAVKTDAGDGKK